MCFYEINKYFIRYICILDVLVSVIPLVGTNKCNYIPISEMSNSDVNVSISDRLIESLLIMFIMTQ